MTLRNGASWQSAVFHRLYDEGGLDRDEAERRFRAAIDLTPRGVQHDAAGQQ